MQDALCEGGIMSKECWSAIRGSVVGTIIGLGFGMATLATIGFDRISLFEGVLLASCSVFGGVLYGALIGVTGAFRKETMEPVRETNTALTSPHVA